MATLEAFQTVSASCKPSGNETFGAAVAAGLLLYRTPSSTYGAPGKPLVMSTDMHPPAAVNAERLY